MSKAVKVSISNTDPGYAVDSPPASKTVTKTVANDAVTVNSYSTGLNATSRNAVVAFKINTGGTPTASFDAAGVVTLTASGTGTTRYLLVEINSSDPANWTVYLNTSGGSGGNFRKGSGGAGRK